MLRRLIAALQLQILEHPKRVVVASLLLTIVAIVLGARVEFRSSRAELAPEGDVDQERWDAFLEEYGGSELLIVCVEPQPGLPAEPETLRPLVDALAVELALGGAVDHVYHRVDVDWFVRRGAYLLSRDARVGIADVLQREGPLLEALAGVAGLQELNELLADQLELRSAAGAAIPDGAGPVLQALADFVAGQRAFLENPRGGVDGWLGGDPLAALGGERAARLGDGYLKTHDQRTWFLFVTPVGTDDGLPFRRGLVDEVRRRAATVLERFPGHRVALTGQPAIVVDEMNSVRSDTLRTSILAITGVSLLTLLVFRWKTHALLVLAALAFGVLWALGAVRLEYGYLNMITSSFISTLIGVGVAYGIHPVSEYELRGAHTGDVAAAVREAFQRTGAGVTVAGVTTAAAFFAIQFMQFRGFSELGIVAGVGVLLCLAAAAFSLPAMVVLYGRRRSRRERRPRARRAPVDRLWSEALTRRICRFPRTVTVVALAVTVLAAWQSFRVDFSNNILDLLPVDAESLRYQRRMMLESDLSPLYNIVAADDLAALSALAERAAAEPEIARFESILDLLPSDPEAVGRELASWRGSLARLVPATEAAPVDPPALRAALERVEIALADAADAAFGAGLGDLVEVLEAARLETERSIEIVAVADPGRIAGWNAGQRELLEWLARARSTFADALDADAPTLDNLPPAVLRRFVTRSGRLLGFLFPRGAVFEDDRLDAFIDASRRVSPEVTGFPVVFHKMSGRITRGFSNAVWIGAVAVTLILLLDYRNVRDAVLALVPLAMGVLWTTGAMHVLGLSFNFANLVAVPLIIGVGIDNGVHVIHRVRLEGGEGIPVVLQHTGRAILIASSTTMIGFGSLALASHRGIASLGTVLLLGVGFCLVTSTVVLPNLLVALGLVAAESRRR